MTAQALIYPVLLLLVGGFVLLTVPRDNLRLLLPYGAVLGGLLEYLEGLITGGLGITAFHNVGLIQAGSYPLLSYIVWTFIAVFFLHFWPRSNEPLGYLYLLGWALLATGFSQVVKGVGLFSYAEWFYPIPMLLLFAARFALKVWVAKRCGLLS